MDYTEVSFRIVVILLSSYNLLWSAWGPKALSCGNPSPPAFYLSFVFFASFTTLAYEGRHFVGPGHEIWIFLLLTLSIVTAVIGIIGHCTGANLKAKQFYSLYDALPQALAIAELSKYDPDAAKAMADECWAKLSTRVANQFIAEIPHG